MKTVTRIACLMAIGSSLCFAQLATWTSTGGKSKEQFTGSWNDYDYELWNQDGIGTATMKPTGTNGGTFEGTWSNTCNVLFRSGKKWGSGNKKSHTDIGNITIDFEATWDSPDDVKYLSVYGWAYFTSAHTPNNFSNQIEYYIVQDRGSYNPCSNKKGSKVIDGISYGFHVCDRMNQPMLTGNGNFKQFFSIPENTSNHRRSGRISVSEHFKAWHEVGMYMDGPMYEVAMKVESYKCNNMNGQGSGSAKVTKNILTIGGTPSTPSSNSGGSTSSSSTGGGTTPSSSSQANTQATTCSNFIGTLPANPNPPANPYTACFKHTNDKCYVCQISNEGNGNTCSTAWVWSGNQVASNLNSGYWYKEVSCPAAASSSSGGGTSSPSGNSSSSLKASSSSGSLSGSCAYQTSFCGGMAYAEVSSDTVSIPFEGDCFYIGDFDVIQPSLNSTISINGLANTCGADWNECAYNEKPSAVDGGYYVYVAPGSSVNAYRNNGWQGVVAKEKPDCTDGSSSSSGTTPIIKTEPLVTNQAFLYYSLRGVPLGTMKPTEPGVYIEKQNGIVRKIVVR